MLQEVDSLGFFNPFNGRVSPDRAVPPLAQAQAELLNSFAETRQNAEVVSGCTITLP